MPLGYGFWGADVDSNASKLLVDTKRGAFNNLQKI